MNAIIEIADYLLTINPISTLIQMIYESVFMFFVMLIMLGLKNKLIDGYFQLIIFAVLNIYCLREALKHMSNLDGLSSVVGVGIVLHFVLAAQEINTPILKIMIVFAVLISITSIAYNDLGLRNIIWEKTM